MASLPPPSAQASQTGVAAASSGPNIAQLSLILGVVSCIPAVGAIVCIPAIICGHLALNRARRASQPVDTRIVVGLALGYVIALIYLWMAIGLFFAPMLSGQ